MYNQPFRPFGYLPPVIKNLMIINGLFFLATVFLPKLQLIDLLGLHVFESPLFRPHQLFTHMFMHDNSSIWHLAGNMFALWLFGRTLEDMWGGKKFLVYYIVTGLGAAALHLGVMEYQLHNLLSNMSPQDIASVYQAGTNPEALSYLTDDIVKLWQLLYGPTVGASGAVYGILLAFGMTYPNAIVYLNLLFPVKVKYLVIFYGGIELYSAIVSVPGDNVAHFAHLGGMLFGYFLVRHWNKNQFRMN